MVLCSILVFFFFLNYSDVLNMFILYSEPNNYVWSILGMFYFSFLYRFPFVVVFFLFDVSL